MTIMTFFVGYRKYCNITHVSSFIKRTHAFYNKNRYICHISNVLCNVKMYAGTLLDFGNFTHECDALYIYVILSLKEEI